MRMEPRSCGSVVARQPKGARRTLHPPSEVFAPSAGTTGGEARLAAVRTLAELTTLRLGGAPARYLEGRDEAAIVPAVRAAGAAGEPLLVLAGGSNVVVADDGFPGTVVRILTAGIDGDGATLTVQAGEPWDPFVE